jgi:hypothetical protein
MDMVAGCPFDRMEFKVTIRPLASNLDPKIATFLQGREIFCLGKVRKRSVEPRSIRKIAFQPSPISMLVRSPTKPGPRLGLPPAFLAMTSYSSW